MVGIYQADAKAVILGGDEAGFWWQIVCPAGVASAECWVVNDERFVDVTTPVASPPAVALGTPTPTATPCDVSVPSGWSAYVIQSGDTLSELAMLSGGSVSQLRAVNCIAGDKILAGFTLYVPAPIIHTPTPAPPPPIPIAQQAAVPEVSIEITLGPVPAGIAAQFAFEAPAAGKCRSGRGPSGEIFIGMSNGEKFTWERGEEVPICFNFSGAEPVTVRIVQPDGATKTDDFDPTQRWDWPVMPGAPLGEYQVTATQGALSDEAVFTVKTAERESPHILVLRDRVAVGEKLDVVVAGYPPGRRVFYLYQSTLTNGQQRFVYIGRLPAVSIDQAGEGGFTFRIAQIEPDGYLVHDGATDETSIERRDDPRIFAVTR